jgi:putative sigma-54 modulation protein
MNLTISGHHLEVTPALRSYVTNKLDRISRHFDQVVDIKVLLSIEKQKEKLGRQRAVDELVDKLDRQVNRHKTKLQNHHFEAAKRTLQ